MPGPADYSEQLIKNMKPRAPGFSMGTILNTRVERTPGPGDYL